MFYYLKVNRNCEYAIKNLQHWIDTIESDFENEYCILCDNESLKSRIINEIYSKKELVFLESEKNEDLNVIVQNVCVEKWKNAGFAHMTTFYDAKRKGLVEFWNIDADDTFICLPPKRCSDLLNEIKAQAVKNRISLFSLDMWRTVVQRVYREYHWTFGITYTDCSIDWMKIATKYCQDEKINELKLIPNIDKYFTYLALTSNVKIESFYIDNLKFMLYLYKKCELNG